jgi:RNA polymerase sigma factor (sigma-70 family)
MMATVTVPNDREFDEKVSDGMMGLIDAAKKYDPTYKAKFKTYARIRVRGSIIDGFRKRHGGKRPRGNHPQMYSLDRALAMSDGQTLLREVEDSITEANPVDEAATEHVNVQQCADSIKQMIRPQDREVLYALLTGTAHELAARRGVTLNGIYYHKRMIKKRLHAILTPPDNPDDNN